MGERAEGSERRGTVCLVAGGGERAEGSERRGTVSTAVSDVLCLFGYDFLFFGSLLKV